MSLKRINRVKIGKLSGTPVFDQVENFTAGSMAGGYIDLEMTDASTVELTSPQIEITGQRGDGQARGLRQRVPVRRGAAGAALAVSRRGCADAMPDSGEIDEFMSSRVIGGM